MSATDASDRETGAAALRRRTCSGAPRRRDGVRVPRRRADHRPHALDVRLRQRLPAPARRAHAPLEPALVDDVGLGIAATVGVPHHARHRRPADVLLQALSPTRPTTRSRTSTSSCRPAGSSATSTAGRRNVMVVAVLLHMARVFFTAAYRKPREFNWLIGMALLVVDARPLVHRLPAAVGPTRLLGDHDRREHRAVAARGDRRAGHHASTSIPAGSRSCSCSAPTTVGEEALIRFYLLHVMILPLVAGGAHGRALLAHPQGWRPGAAGRCRRAARAAAAPTRYPVFTEAPQKTYQLAAIVRGQHAGGRARPGEHRALDAAPVLRRTRACSC